MGRYSHHLLWSGGNALDVDGCFIGSSSAFVESMLGQNYKEKTNGECRGGPAFYIENGLGLKWCAWVFAIVSIFSYGVLLPGVQSNAIAASLHNAFDIDPLMTAGGIALFLAFIIFGGVKRIANFASIVSLFMAFGDISIAVVIIFINIDELPNMLLILNSAFGFDASCGAVLGLTIMWGVKRGVYSNEAGQGTGPHASSAAAVSHPVKQGLVQAFSLYIDILFVCSATGFMLLITGFYNVQGPDGVVLYTGLENVSAGAGYVQVVMDNIMPGFGSMFVAIVLFFAFTAIVAFYYIDETKVAYINRKINRPWLTFSETGPYFPCCTMVLQKVPNLPGESVMLV